MSFQPSPMNQFLSDGLLPFLPEEIITDILKRLPVKSLIRFQCVSKHWKNLIKTPSFVQDHLHHHSTRRNPSILIEHVCRSDLPNLCLLDSEMKFHDLEGLPSIASLIGVGSCNGLICLVDYNSTPPAPLLWNPATREARHIPVTFDDFPVSWHFGFGFSPLTNDYKIVRISETDVIYGVEFCSLNTGSWNGINSDNIKEFSIMCDGVTINGVMFWYGSMSGADTDMIISLDFATEVFTLIPSPALFSHVGVRLAAYEEKLAIISHPRTVNSECGFIYYGVMEVQGRWSLRRIYINDDCGPSKLHVGTIWGNQIVCIDYGMAGFIDATEVEMGNGGLKCGIYLINVTTNKRHWFTIPAFRHGYRASAYNYVESLVPV